MIRRSPPGEVVDRWPYVTVAVPGAEWIAKIPTLPGSRIRLTSDYRDAVIEHEAKHKAAAEAKDMPAVLAAVEATEGAAGWVLLSTWADPLRELEAQTAWRAGAFSGIDEKLQAGRAAIAEICEAFDLTWHHAARVCQELLRAASTGEEPSSADVTEVRFFSGPRSDSAT